MREPYPNDQVVPLDRFINEAYRMLSEAEWEDDEAQVERLHKCIESAKQLSELGDFYWIKF